MNTEKQTKNPHLILDEIAKRLSRISGGVKVYPLHDAIRLAKDDSTKFLECLLFVKNSVVKIGQPTASTHQTVLSIAEYIDEFSGSLSVEEIEYYNTNKISEPVDGDDLYEEPIFEQKTLEDGKIEYKHIVTEADLKNYPELVGEVVVGEEILFTGTSIIIDQDFLDEHPELSAEGLNIGDEIIWDEDDLETEDEDFEEEIEEDPIDEIEDEKNSLEDLGKVDNESQKSIESKEDPIDKIEEESKIVPNVQTGTKSLADVLQAVKPVNTDSGISTDEKLEVKASKTFDGTKTKVTKTLLKKYKVLEGISVVGDYVFIDDKKLYAFVVSDETHAAEHKVNIGDVVIFDEPLELA